jgi:hypothetical protein
MDETKGTTPQRKSKGEKKKCEKQKNQKKKQREEIYIQFTRSHGEKIGGTLEALERISQLHPKQQEVGSRSRRTRRQRKIDEK